MSTSMQSVSGKKYTTKIYVVLQKILPEADGEPNIKVLTAKMSARAAQSYVDAYPDCYLVKVTADKLEFNNK